MAPPDHLLAPGFLIAPPTLNDPSFARALVVLAIHETDGSMGFIVNRTGEMTLKTLLDELEITSSVPDRPVLLGGPVSSYSGFVLYTHDEETPLAPGIRVSSTISVSPSRELLERAARGALPGRFELVMGYAGWGPGQLDAELERGGWLHSAFDAEVLLDIPSDRRWDEVYQRLGVLPEEFISVPGGAQA
jgi:putative transcriptional regulator